MRRFAAAGNIHVLLDEGTQNGPDAPLAAFVRVRLNADTGVGELCILGRAPAYRGLGLGANIVARGLQAVASGGARQAELSVAASNPDASAPSLL